ncbi:MAG: flagellar hook-associated protein FlgK [Magnetospirillum sp.]|nr:flagellar hook-associated protein FlgK [Magnetospirillum sp.]
MAFMNLALGSAVSSLLTLQTRMGLVSSNLANANTQGYTAETASVSALTFGGVGSGVSVGSVSHNVDQFLVAQIAGNTAQTGYAKTANDYYQSLVQAMGQVTANGSGSSGNDLSSSLTTLESALTQLANTPDNAALQSQAASQLDDTLSLMRQTSSQVQQLRGNADQQISSTITEINTALDTIQQTNTAISRAQASNQPTAALEDQRQTALQTLSNDVGVNYFINGNNQMVVMLGGQTLVDAAGDVNHLSHTAVGTMTSQNTYVPGTYSGSHLDGIWAGGVDVTGQIGSGSLKALIDQRDTVLPGVQSQLDALASNLATGLNTISNQGSPQPVPNTLTGTADLGSGGAVTVAAGTTIQLAIANQSTGAITSTYSIPLPSGATTVGAIVSAINTSVPGTASVNSSGALVLTAPASSGIAVTTSSGNLQVPGGSATDFSSLFGLNDLVVNGSSASSIAINPAVQQNPSLTYSYQLSNLTGSSVFASPLNSTAGLLASQMSATDSFTVGGNTTTATFSGYAGNIISGVATQAQAATTTYNTQNATLQSLQSTFNSQSGVNMDQETARMTEYQNAYAASAKVISAIQTMFQSLIQAVQA